MKKLFLVTISLFALSVQAQVSVYDCSVIDPTVTQAEIDQPEYEYYKPCILFSGEVYNFGQDDHKKVTALNYIHIEENFHVGPFNPGAGFHFNLEEKKNDLDVAVMFGDLNSVILFGKLELGIEFPTEVDDKISDFIENGQTALNINPFDPQQINVKAEFWVYKNNQWLGPMLKYGYYHKDFDPTSDIPGIENLEIGYPFRVRFAPTLIGSWKCKITVEIPNNLDLVANEFLFNVIDQGYPDFVSVGPNKKYLKRGSEPFMPVGPNLPFPGTQDHLYSTSNQMTPVLYDGFVNVMQEAKDAGANYFRYMMTPHGTDIEFEKLGDYSDRLYLAWEFDGIVSQAFWRGLVIHLDLNRTDGLEDPSQAGVWRWDWPAKDDPAYAACGWWGNFDWDVGYCYHTDPVYGVTNPDEFLTNVDSKRFFKNKLRYIMSRWGYATSIGPIELMNETNYSGRTGHLAAGCVAVPSVFPYESDPTYPAKLYDWEVEMANYLKTECGVNNHPICVNYNSAVPPLIPNTNWDDNIATSPAIDIYTYNDYNATFWKYEHERDMSFFYDYYNLLYNGETKPLMYSEIGAINCDDDYTFKQSLLMSGFTGSVGPGLTWRYEPTSDEYPLVEERTAAWNTFQVVRDFFYNIDLDEGPWQSGIDVRNDLRGEILYLRSQEENKRAVAVINNRTVNFFTMKEPWCVDPGTCDCIGPVEDWPEGVPPFEAYDNAESFSHGSGGNTNRLFIAGMGFHKYSLEYYNAFTGDWLWSDTKWSGTDGNLRIKHPYLQDSHPFSMYLLKVHRFSEPNFMVINNDPPSENKYLAELIDGMEHENVDRTDPTEIESVLAEPTPNSESSMKIAPNPSTNSVNITLYGETNGINRIEIRSALGELIVSIEQPKNETVVDVSNFANGVYYVSGYGSDAPIHSKLIKQ